MLARLATGVTATLLAGCMGGTSHGQIVQEVEFLRGCWVSKDEPGGRVTGFLRLLPAEPGADSYSGVSQTVQGSMTRDRFRFSFARDGSRLSVTYPDGATETAPARPGASRDGVPHRAVYLARPADPNSPSLVAEGDGESLSIFPVSAAGESGDALFRGDRDGCD